MFQPIGGVRFISQDEGQIPQNLQVTNVNVE